ncbi:hypothetical protein DUNSADRAFT_16705 [Dunaliella salina]|uniref:Fucosyltransferase n=1 Tax=Dunaliella salina TaxID=3046 RepID=A0ABQ7G326_DUNSA|nr:hypothetical protein DUNSADRAFT_16705 [Dunaliella salina]|eukprot:KAF5829001.1 hypothetical protein DUNSADRAFT_16705 [Dunaliella salina]
MRGFQRFHVAHHSPKPRPMPLPDALKDPVVIAVMTNPSIGAEQPTWNVTGCSWERHPLGCQVTGSAAYTHADVLLYHASATPCPIGQPRSWPWQLRAIWSTESSEYHPVLEKRACMDEYDVEVSYRTCSQVFASSFDYSPQTLSTRLFLPPLPFEAKENSVAAFLDEDCGTLSKREELVRELVAKGLHVAAWGKCLSGIKGHHDQAAPDRSKLYRKYKFCIAFETSLTQDYVTEELWQALEAGCLPLYLGAPNIKDFLPAQESIINLADAETRKSIAHIVKRLSKNSTAYNAHLAWKRRPLSKLSTGFQKMVASSQAAGGPSKECKLCQLAMVQRVATSVPAPYTHCLRNGSWLKAQRTHASSWGPGTNALLKGLSHVQWPHSGSNQWSAKHGQPA